MELLIDNDDIWMTHIINEDITSLKNWIIEYKRINYVSQVNGYSLLTWACINQKEKIIKFLLESGADPFYKDKKNNMPWIMALTYNIADVKHWDYLYNIESFTKNIVTKHNLNQSLPFLIKNKNEEAIKFIFKYISVNEYKGVIHFVGTNIFKFIPYSTLAHHMKSKAFLKILTDNKYDLSTSDDDGLNVYDYCRLKNDNEWLDFLLNLKETPKEQIEISRKIEIACKKLFK